MNKRDLQIIRDLERFRVMSRDDIIDLYFSHLKNPITGANIVLKRLVRDKQIDVSKSFSPFVYFPNGSTMKRNSTKIPHFLKLVEIYRQLQKHARIDSFLIEPKYKKGLAEPDILVTIKGRPFFIEVQRNLYSQKVMDQKMKRYEALKYSGEFEQFPYIIMVSDTRYEIKPDLKVFQVTSINEFIENVKRPVSKEITIKIG